MADFKFHLVSLNYNFCKSINEKAPQAQSKTNRRGARKFIISAAGGKFQPAPQNDCIIKRWIANL
jgi:hypothetical protein